MNKKKVLYFIHSMCKSRVMKTFKEDADLNQVVVGPKPRTYEGIIEGYDDFGIKDIRQYDNLKEAQKIINKVDPDVVVQTDMTAGISFPKKSKRVFVMHGTIGNHTKEALSHNFKGVSKTWSGFDLYCGSSNDFKDWINYVAGKGNEILLNALPQFDLFHLKNYKTADKDMFMKRTKSPKAKKVILYCGFCCKNRIDYNDHNEDYFKTVLELQKISEKNNYLSLIKPRQTYKQIMKFIDQEKYFEKYRSSYIKAQNSNHLYFVHPDSSLYNYFFADIVVVNGCSTVEIETCLAHKPLVVVRTAVKPEQYDPFDTVKSGVAFYVPNINDLETMLTSGLNSKDYKTKQDNFIKSMGILADGLAAERIQNRIKLL